MTESGVWEWLIGMMLHKGCSSGGARHTSTNFLNGGFTTQKTKNIIFLFWPFVCGS